MSSRRPPTRIDIVVQALFLLRGGLQVIDTEDVASKCFEIKPELFRWRTRADQINVELVRVALSDAKKPRLGWVEGSGRTGWSLTPAGRAYAQRVADRPTFARADAGPSVVGAGRVADDARRHRELCRIHGTAAWKSWARGEKDASARNAAEVFRIDSYSSPRIRSFNINRLRSLFCDQPEIGEFLDVLASTLGEVPIKRDSFRT